jgi:hypothetical protein
LPVFSRYWCSPQVRCSPFLGLWVWALFYLPIYHTIVFDRESDTIVLEKMNKQNVLLQGKILNNERITNPWLLAEAKSRNIPKII